MKVNVGPGKIRNVVAVVLIIVLLLCYNRLCAVGVELLNCVSVCGYTLNGLRCGLIFIVTVTASKQLAYENLLDVISGTGLLAV